MKKIITTVLCATMAVCNTLNAQETMKENKAFSVADMSSFKSHNGNPWGLVYADALTENKVGAVNIQPITYRLHGLKSPPTSICLRAMTWRKAIRLWSWRTPTAG